MPLDLLLDLLKLGLGAGAGQIAAQWLVPRIRRAKDVADVRQTQAATAKTEVETRAAEFAFYRDQLTLLKGDILELRGRLESVEGELQDLHAAIDAEPDDIRVRILTRSLARRRARAAVADPEIVINGPTTINGAVAGGNINSIQEARPA